MFATKKFKTKKHLLLVGVLCILVLLVAACGGSAEPAATGGASNAGAGDAGGAQSTDANDNGDSSEADEAETITITHDLGETTVAKNPESIVVFDFGMLDTLDYLGIEVSGVPQASIPPYLSKYDDDTYINVGSLKEPDFEAIAEIRPDLIIISGRQSELYDELSELGATVFLGVDNTDYMNSFKQNVLTLGQIFDMEAEIEEEIAQIEERLAALAEQASSAGETLIVLVNEGNISAYGPGSRFGLIHDEMGFVPVDEQIEASTHGMNVSFEYLLEQNPDILFAIDRGAALGGETSAQETLENDLVQQTAAYQNDRIIYLDPNYWYLSGGGIVSVSEMIADVEQVFTGSEE